jgi:6-phosphofructokinase 2
LGGSSRAVFTCGGANGHLRERLIAEKGIEYKAIPVDGVTRENLTVFEEHANQGFRFVMPGPRLLEKEWEAVLGKLSSLAPKPEYMVASGSLPKGVPDDFYLHVAEIAHELGSRLVIDTSGKQLALALEEGAYLLKPNLRELEELAGIEIKSEDQEVEFARSLITSSRTEVVVVSLGAGGALLVTKDQEKQLRTPTVPVRSKLGAGDSMVAGIVLSLAKGWAIEEATKYGIAAGAATVSTHGTQFCTKGDTDQLYHRLSDQSMGDN